MAYVTPNELPAMVSHLQRTGDISASLFAVLGQICAGEAWRRYAITDSDDATQALALRVLKHRATMDTTQNLFSYLTWMATSILSEQNRQTQVRLRFIREYKRMHR